MTDKAETGEEEVRELLGYTLDDLGNLASSTAELGKIDPDNARRIAVDTLGILAESMTRFTAIVNETEPEAAKRLGEDYEPKQIKATRNMPDETGDFRLASERVGILKDDPKAKQNIKEIRALREEIGLNRWGIEDPEQLERICQLIYGAEVDKYLDEAYDAVLALPDTDDFKPFQLVLDGDRVVCAEGNGCIITPGYRLLVLNLMAMTTYFGGAKSKVIKRACHRSLSEMANSGFYSQGYKGSEVVMNRGPRDDLTYILDAKWRAEGVLALS